MKASLTNRAYILMFILAAGCGAGNHASHLNDTTDFGNQPIGSVREFWIYESSSDGLGTSGPFTAESTTYFPEAMPLNGEDFFWLIDSGFNAKIVTYRPSLLPDIPHTVPNIPLPANGSGILKLDLPFEQFDLQEAPKWEFVFTPTFTVARGANGQTYRGTLNFTIEHVCYEVLTQDPDINILPINGQLSTEISSQADFAVSSLGQKISVEKLYTNEVHAPIARACSQAGGTLASQLHVTFNFQNPTPAEAQVEVTGLKIRYLTFQ